ncbi:MAG: hypothetical protein PVI75_06335 [Gammaproteobacteria bacterium]|jgi:hypothetical protein
MYKIKRDGNCLPNSLAAVLIDFFQQGKLNAQFAAGDFDRLIQHLCIEEKFKWQTDAATSFKVFLNKYSGDLVEAREQFAKLIRKYIASLIEGKKEEIINDEISGIFPDFLREWNLVHNGAQLNSSEHIFHGVQGELKKIKDRKALKTYIETGGGFDHYIRALKNPSEFLNVVPVKYFLTHLQLNFTVETKPRGIWRPENPINGFKNAPTVTLRFAGRHWWPKQSTRFNGKHEISQKDKSSRTVHDFFANDRRSKSFKRDIEYLLNKKKNEVFKYDNSDVKRIEKLPDKVQEQIRGDKKLAIKMQQKEIDNYRASLKSFVRS